MGQSPLAAEMLSTGTTIAVMQADGVVLGRYRIRRRLGSGGFGTVWLARDERLERDVALKLLALERIASGRFEREARAAARLNHPGIVTLYEAAVDDEGAYLVSELVRGSTLAEMIQDGTLSDRGIVAAALALCDALEYAHHQGVVHRDVKPSNVLLPDSPATSAELAKLTDFGVARLIGGDSLTRTGDVLGTTAYMAPEQAEGREVQPVADLYSLALVIYEALTGINPLRLSARSPRGGRLGAYLPALRRYRRDLPRELACAVDLALRPRPRERGDVRELRVALLASLEQVEDHPGVVAPPWPSLIKARRRADEDPRPPGQIEEIWRSSPSPAWSERADDRGPPLEFIEDRPARSRERPAPGLVSRGIAAVVAAVAAAWFAATVLSPAPVLPVLALIGAGALVAIVPRLGWLALVSSAVVLLFLQHSDGAAVVVGATALASILLLWRHPARWPLAALTPVLATVGVAGAWPALAGRAPTAWQRAVLGATGWIWLLVGGFLGGADTYAPLPKGAPAPALWMPSLYEAVHHVLLRLLSSGVLVPALVWGAGAAVFPLIGASPRSRRPMLALAWAVAVAVLTAGSLAVVNNGTLRPWPAFVGVLACTVLALVPDVWRGGAHRTARANTRAGLA